MANQIPVDWKLRRDAMARANAIRQGQGVEELAEIIPELAPLDADGAPISVSYDRLTSVLCKAVQELNAKVEALQAQVDAL